MLAYPFPLSPGDGTLISPDTASNTPSGWRPFLFLVGMTSQCKINKAEGN